MKKLLLTILASFLLAGATWAGPFLTCDPQPNADEYRVFIDGTEVGISEAKLDIDTGYYYLWYDLGGLAEGDHTAEATAINEWGESGKSAPLSFTKAVPGIPTNLRVFSE